MNETEEIKEAPEKALESPTSAPEPETPSPGKAELAALENAIYRKHIDALNAELAELRQKYDIKPDPTDTLAIDVRELKGQFAELKAMIENFSKAQNPPAPPAPAWQPQSQPFSLPYISTPSYTPLMPATTTLFR